jgi:hypothetical protein
LPTFRPLPAPPSAIVAVSPASGGRNDVDDIARRCDDADDDDDDDDDDGAIARERV